MTAWKMGLKTTYYLRTLGASAIEKSTLDVTKNYEGTKEAETSELLVAADTATSAELPATAVTSACLLEDPTCEACQ